MDCDRTAAVFPLPRRGRPLRGARAGLPWFFVGLLLLGWIGLAAADDEEGAEEAKRLKLVRIEGALKPGEKTAIVALGELEGVHTLHIDAADVEVTPAFRDDEPANGRATFEVRLPDDAAVGPVAARAVSAADGRASGGASSGVSNPMMMMVDDLPSVGAPGDNPDRARAQGVDLPVAVDGVVHHDRLHYFRFEAGEGQRVTVDVVAARLGSRLDPMLRLLDAEGKVLATAGDEPGLGADARIRHTFDEAGDYFIELRDTVYEGGEGYHYRLRIGDLPTATAAMPGGVQAGKATEVQLVGRAQQEGADLPTVRVEAAADARRVRVSARGEGHDGSAYAAVLVEDLPHVQPGQPGGDVDSATAIEPPAVIVSRFAEADRPHHYRFAAEEGERLGFFIQSQRLGSVANVYPRLLNADGNRVAEPDDPGVPGPSLTHTFEAAGEYVLRLDELHYRAGPAHTYRVAVVENPPRFSLTTGQDSLHVEQGGSAAIKAAVSRSGYGGPIDMQVASAEELAVEIENGRIEQDAEEHEFAVAVPEDAATGLHFIRLRGEAANDAPDVAPLSTAPAIADALPGLEGNPPAELDGRIAVFVHRKPEPAEDADEADEPEAADDAEQAEDDDEDAEDER